MESTQVRNSVLFNGRAGEFFGIWIVNVLLSIITLGIYSAWAKVRTKRYFYGNTQIAQERFEYHATPIQILKGRLIAVGCVIAWVVLSTMNPIISSILLLAFYVALPWLLWSNARFDCAMTSFANVRFSFAGSLKDAYITLFGRAVCVFVGFILAVVIISVAGAAGSAVALTIGVIGSLALLLFGQAWVMQGVYKYFLNGYRYGQREFSAEIKTAEFVKIFLFAALVGLGILLIIFAVGFFTVLGGTFYGLDNLLYSGVVAPIMMVTYYLVFLAFGFVMTAFIAARIRNYIFSQAQLSNGDKPKYNFESSLSASSYAWLIFSNLLAQIVTFGLARPWVMVRTARYVASRTTVIGDVSQLDAKSSDSNIRSAASDEIAEAFDVGIGIG